jgi:DNA-binding SARP family transcriptional activator
MTAFWTRSLDTSRVGCRSTSSSDRALSSLQAYISRLRSILEPNRKPRDRATVLVSQLPGYRLAVARPEVDVFRFEDEIEVGRAQLRNGRSDEAVRTLDGALQLRAGRLLPEFADKPFVHAEAQRVDSLLRWL